MKRMMIVIGLAVGMASSSASAATSVYSRPSASGNSGNFGIGVMLGEPTGVSAKYWLSRSNALAFGLTYSFNRSMGLLADYLWHFPGAFGNGDGAQFVPFVGVGGIAFFGDHGDWYYDRYRDRYYYNDYRDRFALGVRVPIGLEFLPRSAPLGIFAEIVPGVGIIPGLFGMMQADIGIRFYL